VWLIEHEQSAPRSRNHPCPERSYAEQVSVTRAGLQQESAAAAPHFAPNAAIGDRELVRSSSHNGRDGAVVSFHEIGQGIAGRSIEERLAVIDE
jgi:hypothetical protein